MVGCQPSVRCRDCIGPAGIDVSWLLSRRTGSPGAVPQVMFMLSRRRQTDFCGSARCRASVGPRYIVWTLEVCLFFALACSRAAAYDQVLQGYHHTAWTNENGFSAVWTIQQAPDGFLWLTTPTGVFRFDGQRFESTDEVTNRQVHNADIVTVFPSPSGGVWLTTRSHGLLLWKDNRVTNYPDRRCTPAQGLNGVVEDRDGSLWIASSAGLFRLKNGNCEQIHNDPAFPGGFPLAILMDREGTLWVKWPTGALYFLKIGEHKFNRCSSVEGAGGEYAFLNQAPDGSIWLSDAGGLRRVTAYPDPTTPLPAAEKTHKPHFNFENFAFTPNGALWAASGKGVYRFNSVEQYKLDEPLSTSDAEAFTVNQGLSASVASALLIDREGTVWIGTTSGLDQLRRNVFSTLAMPKTTDHQFAIAAGDDGSVWAGNREQPLTHISKDGHAQVFARTNQSIAIRRTSDGSIWSSSSGDVRLWQTTGGDPSPVASPPGDIRSAADIAVDRNHELWITTLTPDSYHRVGTSWTKVTEDLGRKPGVIGAMAGDSDGNVWFAFSNKLVEWDGSTYHRFSFPEGTLNISVAVVSARGDHIWLGGLGGVVLFSHGHFQLMRWKDEGNPGRISGLVETEVGELWLNGTSGVIRVPADELKRWLNDSEYGVSADRFGLQDGLPGLAEERWPEPSLVESSSGILWLSTTKGIVWIDPSKLGGTRNRIPPPVFVNNVVYKGKRYSGTNGPLALPPKGNLEFNYTALSLAIPERVLFRYKLEGIDTDWQNAGTRRQAFYTNLPPGKYRFHVIACNNDGVWNEEGARLDFVIAPAWYQTIWFRLLYVTAFLAFLWGLYQLRVQRLRREERKFREAFESIPTMAWIGGPGDVIQFLNRRWVEYTGLSNLENPKEIRKAAIHPDDLDRIERRLTVSIASGEPIEEEVRLRRTDGEYRWFLSRVVPLRDRRGKVVRWYGAATDIQDGKRAEQLQTDLAHTNRLSILGELVASISHELAQPITATTNNAKASLRWLQREPPDLKQVRKGTESIIEAGTFASEIIDRLRSLYKKSTPKRELVPINEVISDMTGMLRSEARRYGVSVRTDLKGDLPMTVADRVQLQQVFMNLMLNGIEAMKDTGGVLTVNSQLGEDGQIEISVNDTGPGLTPGKADQIFDAFFTTKPQGSGMGLAISKSIVEAHGGRIWANGNGGRGATFHFTLPAAPPGTNPPVDAT
jgi:PAS domain S-box-containing protein